MKLTPPDPRAEITALGRRSLGLLGWPVGHSLSPQLMQAAFDSYALDWSYGLLPVRPQPRERLAEAIAGLRALSFRGANVTVPYKSLVLPLLDELSHAARSIGAVNTISLDGDKLWGHNTDAPGFVADLRAHGLDPAVLRVLVLGAGGSARAVVYGLAEAGCPQIEILNRTPARARALALDIAALFPDCRLNGLPSRALDEASLRCDLIVNCTPLGMVAIDGSPWDSEVPMRRGMVVYDLVYNPRQTAFLRFAERSQCQTLSGLGMLVQQAARAFTLWTGLEAPLGQMRRAAERALAGRGDA